MTHRADDSPAEEAADDADGTPRGSPRPPSRRTTPHAPDDALGLYLRQMGAIPLLNRKQELALAKRLEIQPHAATATPPWSTGGPCRAVVETFERVLAGELALDPTIDVVTRSA